MYLFKRRQLSFEWFQKLTKDLGNLTLEAFFYVAIVLAAICQLFATALVFTLQLRMKLLDRFKLANCLMFDGNL